MDPESEQTTGKAGRAVGDRTDDGQKSDGQVDELAGQATGAADDAAAALSNAAAEAVDKVKGLFTKH